MGKPVVEDTIAGNVTMPTQSVASWLFATSEMVDPELGWCGGSARLRRVA